MYIWKIEDLKKDLKQGPLSEKESFKYLLAFLFFVSLGAIPMEGSNKWDLYSALAFGAITILGTWYLYICNGGEQGKNFVERYLSLGLVVAIRWTVFIFLPLFIVYLIAFGEMEMQSGETTSSYMVFGTLTALTYYGLLMKHFKDLVKVSETTEK